MLKWFGKWRMCLVIALAGAWPAIADSWFVVNEDNDHFFKLPSSEMTEKGLCEYADYVARGKVTHVFLCVCGQRTSYDSKTWEPIWVGLTERARKDTATMPDGTHDRWAVNCKLLHDKGIDPYAVWIARFREKGVSPWVSMRMNDVHFGSDTNYFRNTSFYKRHRDWWINPTGLDWCDWQLDYARPEVRDYALAQVREIAGRWDADGIELDWMRFGNAFRCGHERKDAHLLDGFMREVRTAVDAAGRRRGRPMKVAVRVPATPEQAEALGFNAVAWARDGLVDVVIPDNFIKVPHDLPVAEWLRLLKDTRARLVPGTGSSMPPGMRRSGMATFYRGIAASFCKQGATGVYVFNLPYLSNVRYSTDGGGDDLHDVAAELYANGIFPEDARASVPMTPPQRDGVGQPTDAWACRESHPAVVNPVLGEGMDVISLRGEWQFTTNRATASHAWMDTMPPQGPNRPGARTIRVPGCWESQGVGACGKGDPWACWWDASPKMLRHQFTGEAWYCREVELPKAWKDRRIWLKVGGVNAQGWFWVNGRRVAWSDAYCGTFKYEITALVRFDGPNWVVANVCNAMPSRRGCMNSVNTYGGIIRDVELEATPETFADDVWVRGDYDGQCAEVHVALAGVRGAGLVARATVEGRCAEFPVDVGDNLLRVPLADFRPWSPEHPNLYTAKVELVSADGKVIQSRRERFGVRKFETRGNRFYLNGRPFFMRGAGWHWIWPDTGVPPPDRAMFLKYARKVRAAGFNAVRIHTSCPFPEFFEAADEAGLMVEAELPYYQDRPADLQAFDPVRDLTELVLNCRRHPSFAIVSGGNEGWFGQRLSVRLYETLKALDADRLMIGHDRWHDPNLHQADTSDYQGGKMTVWPRGSVRTSSPFVCHEYLNLCVKFDSRLAGRFTGLFLPPTTRDDRKAWLAKFGLGLERGDLLQDSQNALQRVWRKYGLEAARGDPECSGYSYWSLQDACSPQNGAFTAQAVFDPYWNVKPHGDTAESVAVYNSPTCLLLDDGDDSRVYESDPRKSPGDFDMFVTPGITNRVRRSGETIRWTFRLAHYGDAPLKDARLEWKLVAEGKTLLAETRSVGDQALGPVRDLCAVETRAPSVPHACKAVLSVSLTAADGTACANAWDYWIFPNAPKPVLESVAATEPFYSAFSKRFDGLLPPERLADARTVIAREGTPEAAAALAHGQNLVTLSKWEGAPNCFLGWWWMGSQMGVALTDSPLLRKLPHEGMISPLLFRIIREGTPLPVEGFSADDLVIYGEGGTACYLYLAERKLPNGKRHVMVSGLDLVSDTPEGTAILEGILK